MLTNLNNNNILQGLSTGLPLFILEYFPSLKPGVIVTPAENDNTPITPVAIAIQRGYIQGQLELSSGKNPSILTFEQYHASFSEYYNSILAQFANNNIKINLSHIGVDTLYRNYRYISEFYTIGGLVNITESTDYVRLDVDTNLSTVLRSIPELAVFGVSYRTFCSSILRMFPEMGSSLSLAGSVYAYSEYIKLFNKVDRTFADYQIINGMDINTLSNQIAIATQGVDPDIIRTAIREQSDSPALQNYIKLMINNNIPSKVAINLLAYHPSVISIAIKAVRAALSLPIDGELNLPLIFTLKSVNPTVHSATLY